MPSRIAPGSRERSAPRCARTSMCSTPPTCTPATCWVCGWRRTWMIPPATCRSCCRAAWGCRTGTTTSIRRRTWPASAPSTRRISPPCWRWRICRTRTARPPASSTSSDAWRRCTGTARNPKRYSRATITGPARTSQCAHRASTGKRFSAPRASRGRKSSWYGSRALSPTSSCRARPAAQEEFVVWQPSALTGLSALSASQPLETWKDYLRFHAIERNAAYLPKAFVAEDFEFHGRALSGTPQLRPRWKRAMADTDNALGEAVGRLYVQRYFPPAEKARAEAMVRNLLAAFAVRIDQLAWMAPETRARAKAKLTTLKVGVGYPDKWRDYSGLKVIRGDAFGNAQRAELFELHYNLAKLGAAVDRSEWVMNPQLVNAVNLPAMNALNFPAAMLQPPYFDPQRDPVMDYGATGAVIGHEI